ncbi:MAG: GNAT family protein [Anaerolineae bacterium]
MQKLLFDIPTRIETERLYLRCYQPGDGQWYYPMAQRNRSHLERYESGNAVMTIESENDAEATVRDFAAAWMAREAFFFGAFTRADDQFVAQIYVGVVSWDLPEFEVGYFVDLDHEGMGYVTEAFRGSLGFIFEHLKAHRVCLGCNDSNTRSYRVAERCGMVKEAHIRENKRWPDGTLTGTLRYGLLRSEWEAQR